MYIQSQLVSQCWIYGDSLKDHIIGFFVIEPATVKKWAENKGKEYSNEIVNDKELIQDVFEDLMKLAGENKLNSLEKPKQILLISDPWSEDNGFLTPTFKMKRNVAK